MSKPTNKQGREAMKALHEIAMVRMIKLRCKSLGVSLSKDRPSEVQESRRLWAILRAGVTETRPGAVRRMVDHVARNFDEYFPAKRSRKAKGAA